MLRISNLTTDGQISDEEMVFLERQKVDDLKNAQVRPGDLVISQRGTLGLPAIVPETYPVWVISANLIAVSNPTGPSTEFIRAFLTASPGRTQLERTQSGQVQGKITTADVAGVLLPTLKNEAALLASLHEARAERQALEAQADGLLAGVDSVIGNALGTLPIGAEERRDFAVRLGDLRRSRKLAAGYFHPERVYTLKMLETLSDLGHVRSTRLEDLADFIRDAVDVPSDADYLGLASVQSHTGERVEANEQAEGKAFTFLAGDVLFSRLRPYLNKVYRAEEAGVCSTEFHVVRPKPGASLLPDYLAAVLRSSLTLAQTRHMTTGNTHPRLANEDVADLVVPVPSPNVQRQIVEEIERRRTEARRLRMEAARRWAEARAAFERELLADA